ncbi:hypothetical protein BDZ97DRAFT_704149 [Flammula alnicola]|nr:hypothetical protein BDZ97DRAFT_704149 [Flammula alnicola]
MARLTLFPVCVKHMKVSSVIVCVYARLAWFSSSHFDCHLKKSLSHTSAHLPDFGLSISCTPQFHSAGTRMIDSSLSMFPLMEISHRNFLESSHFVTSISLIGASIRRKLCVVVDHSESEIAWPQTHRFSGLGRGPLDLHIVHQRQFVNLNSRDS